MTGEVVTIKLESKLDRIESISILVIWRHSSMLESKLDRIERLKIMLELELRVS